MRKWILYILCILCLFWASGCGADPDVILKGESASSSATENTVPENENGQTSQCIYVYICGAVKKPGVYELEPDSRIYQLVEKAGGMKKNADEQSVNLAETLSDGQMIQIPVRSKQKEKGTAGVERSDGQSPASAGIAADGKVNINAATAEQLMTLNGIGEAKAQQIIAYRDKNGSFQNIEDIMQVEGIKEGTFEKIRESITVQ